jgi:OmpA-OmpF porin, OOP family
MFVLFYKKLEMKNLIVVLAIIFALPLTTEAQLGGLVNRAKNKANNQIDKKVDKEMEKQLEKMFNGSDTTAKETAPKSATETGLVSYSKYDFVQGEMIIYSNDFAEDPMGELPIGWNTNGSGAVSKLQGLDGNWVQLFQNSAYLTDNKQSFTENFTVEFDLVLRRTNPQAAFPMFTFGVLSSGSDDNGSSELLKAYHKNFATEMKIQPYDNGGSHLHYHSWAEDKQHLVTDIIKSADLDKNFNKKIHIAMQIQKERLRIWFNEKKIYDLPKAIVAGTNINQLYFDVKRYGGSETEVGYLVSNIRIAKGLPDTRHKLVEEGKFSTTGILFDVNAATIKPESSGVLKEVADVMKTSDKIRVRITGHTDSDGVDATNLTLSQKRAEAIKQALITDFGISADRIETDGKGETKPVGDNKTREGKAQNRRVEFEKI